MNAQARPGGLFGSVKRLMATGLETVQVRLELLGTEIEFEKRRIFEAVLWGGVALIVFGVALILLSGFVVFLFPEVYRLHALGLISLVLLVMSSVLLFEARRRLSSPPGIFKASLTELQKDQSGLGPAGADARG